jgi:hypothetical protein
VDPPSAGEASARLGPTLLSRSRPQVHQLWSSPVVRSLAAGETAHSDEPGEEGAAEPPQRDQTSAGGVRLTVGDPSLSLLRMSAESLLETGPILRAETFDCERMSGGVFRARSLEGVYGR